MKTKVFYFTTKIMVAVVLLALIAVKAFASDAPKLKMVPYSDNRAIVAVDNLADVVSELTIEDANGYILYYKEGRISDKLYSKIFDFKNLADGLYTVSVKNKYGEQKADFRISNKKFELVEKTEAYTPYFEVNGDILKLSFLNRELNDVEFSLLGDNGCYFEKTLGKDFNITKGFDIASLYEGEYSVELKSGNDTYSYTFEK